MPRQHDLLRANVHLVGELFQRALFADLFGAAHAAERTPRQKRDAVGAALFQHAVVKWRQMRRAVLILHARNRHNFLRDFDLLDADVAQSGELNFARIQRLAQDADRIGEGHVGVGPVKLIKRDRVELQRLQTRRQGGAQVFGPPVGHPFAVGPHVATFGGDDDGIAQLGGQTLQRGGEQSFVVAGFAVVLAVSVGGIPQRHAQFGGARQNRDALWPGNAFIVGLDRHRHSAQSNRADERPVWPQLSLFHTEPCRSANQVPRGEGERLKAEG